MIKRSSLYFLVLLMMSSCGSKTFDTTEELIEYITDEDNGYKYSKEVNGVNYELQYRPTDLLVEQELDKNHDLGDIKSIRNKYNKFIYFNLSISMNNQELLNNVVKNDINFSEMVSDLAFNMNKKVFFTTPKKDTIEMIDFVYPRMYGISNTTKIMLVYPRVEKHFNEDYINFCVEDLGFSTGDVRFKIKMNPLKKEPKLNL